MQLLTVKEVAAKLSISKSGVWAAMAANPLFPQAVKLSTRRTRWHISEVDSYIESLKRTGSLH